MRALRVGLEHLAANLPETEQILLLDGDLYFHPHILELMLRNKTDTTVAVDTCSTFSGEEVMTKVDANMQVTQMGKDVTQKPYGEAVGSINGNNIAFLARHFRVCQYSKLDMSEYGNSRLRFNCVLEK